MINIDSASQTNPFIHILQLTALQVGTLFLFPAHTFLLKQCTRLWCDLTGKPDLTTTPTYLPRYESGSVPMIKAKCCGPLCALQLSRQSLAVYVNL